MKTPAAEIIDQVVSLRRVRSALAQVAEQRRLARVTRQLRRGLGTGVAKRQAAAALGVSIQALDRWIDAGKVPVVRRPGSSRDLVETDALLTLAGEVARLREQGVSRALATAITALDAQARLPRRLRPNQSARELRGEFLRSGPAGRLRQAIELSHTGAALAANARARRARKL